MTKLNNLTITQAKLGLEKKEFSVKELVDSHFDAMKEHRDLNMYILEMNEIAYANAEKSQNKINKGESGLLEGIPVAVKDLYCTKDIRTTSCSNILKNFIPKYESTVTKKIFDQGAIMLGKTNMDEFAMGSANINSCFGNVKNPWKVSGEDLVPGGSSGGSAAAVASESAMFALGSDTGGSVRQPASFCGIVGMKPTYGRCSRYGMIAFSSSLDQAGVFARCVEDTALSLQAMMGFDDKDSTSVDIEVPNLYQNLKNVHDLKGVKIGIPKEYNIDGLSPEVLALWKQGQKYLQEAGAELIEISLPHSEYGLGAYYIIAPAEASSNLARYDGMRYGYRTPDPKNIDEMYELSRERGFGTEVKRRIMIGTYVLSLDQYEDTYLKAQKVRHLIINDFKSAFQKVDAILAPSVTGEAFAINKKMTPLEMYMNDVFTIPASLAGLPCISVPVALSKKGLPLGLQIIGNSFDEAMVLKVSKILELQAKFTAKAKGV
ncbi:MAG: Asp-tRNA(Asn)/Glu-tRNA(Gln) amidotransferase subunit GatA [Pseudomonadota bacterium]